MRCKECFYILDHLDSRTCPECGVSFDPADADTFTRKPPFIRWTFWLPAILLIGGGGGVLWSLLVIFFGFTFATTLIVPAALGVIAGYKGKARLATKILIGLIGLGAALGVLGSASLVGGFCGAVLAVLAMIPLIAGVLAGSILRRILAKSKFSQRDYLRSILLQCAVLLIPVIAACLEGRHPSLRPIIVTTSASINAPPAAAWHGIQFFEEVRRPVPWLLLLSPSLRPMYTIGHSEKVGDIKTCVYQHGKLVKRITEVIPGRRLAFRVIQQDRIETDGAVLLDGSFDLEPIDNGKRTRVILTTRYMPLLTPRFAYQWAEALAIHTLHGHVLAGMKDTAEAVAQ